MKLKNYGRNQKKRKEYIKQSGLLLVGVDVRVCLGDTIFTLNKKCLDKQKTIVLHCNT